MSSFCVRFRSDATKAAAPFYGKDTEHVQLTFRFYFDGHFPCAEVNRLVRGQGAITGASFDDRDYESCLILF